LNFIIYFNYGIFQGAEKIAELLERAKEVIPPSEFKNTPLAMKATAGLRLLPVEKAEGLLEEVRHDSEKYHRQMTFFIFFHLSSYFASPSYYFSPLLSTSHVLLFLHFVRVDILI